MAQKAKKGKRGMAAAPYLRNSTRPAQNSSNIATPVPIMMRKLKNTGASLCRLLR
jgi:hypothetical protein